MRPGPSAIALCLGAGARRGDEHPFRGSQPGERIARPGIPGGEEKDDDSSLGQ